MYFQPVRAWIPVRTTNVSASAATAEPTAARARAERNAGEATRALAEVRRVAETEDNLLPSMREALRVRCTVGEICEELRAEFSTYDAQRA